LGILVELTPDLRALYRLVRPSLARIICEREERRLQHPVEKGHWKLRRFSKLGSREQSPNPGPPVEHGGRLPGAALIAHDFLESLSWGFDDNWTPRLKSQGA
jgi:hypothetical protein